MSIDISKVKAGDEVYTICCWREVHEDAGRLYIKYGPDRIQLNLADLFITKHRPAKPEPRTVPEPANPPDSFTLDELEDAIAYLRATVKPEPEPEEWLTADMMAKVMFGDDSKVIGTKTLKIIQDLNALLTRKYGPPPIGRTFNGEPPEQFGLEKDSWVLWFEAHNERKFWEAIKYCDLDPGDRWMKQFPAPEGE